MRVKTAVLLLVAASAALLASEVMAQTGDPVLVDTMEPTWCFLPSGQAPGGSHAPAGIAAAGSSLIVVNRAYQGEFYEYTFDDGCPFVRSFNPPGICPGDPAFDGSSLWYTDCFDDVVYRVDLDGNLIESLSNGLVTDASMTWDGTSLWAVQQGQPATVYKLDTSLQVLASFTVDTYLMAIAWAGDALWAGDLWGRIYHLATDGTICGEWSGLAGARISGMTVDDAGFLYAIDVISDVVYKFDVSDVPPCVECWDNDEDGYKDATCGGDDCDDTDPNVNPSAEESTAAGNCGDGVDNDCDGQADSDFECVCPDADGDGYRDDSCGGDDCDDANAEVNPGHYEVKGNGIDDDCDGATDEEILPISPLAWDPMDESIYAYDDDYVEYTMPFPFPFFGRDIVKISVNTNGLIELLEAGESCEECDDYCTHYDEDHSSYDMDAIFAANDDLISGVIIEGSMDRVEVTWIGTTYYDDYFEDYSLLYKVILFSDGRVQWKFFDMGYDGYDCDLFSGVYDEVGDVEYEVPGGSTSFWGEDVDTAFEFDPTIPDILAIDWDPMDESIYTGYYGDVEYTMPFTFPFFGRDIVNINVNTNGLIELLETGESCSECDDYCTHYDEDHSSNMDAIFAANDDLISGVIIEGSMDRVEVTWIGTTYYDDYFEDYSLLYKVILFSDGRVQWKFFDMGYDGYDCDLFSGMYDEVGDVEYEVPGGSTSFYGEDVDTAFQFKYGIDIGPYLNLTAGRMLEYIHMIDEGSGFEPVEMYINGIGQHSEDLLEAKYPPPDYTASVLHLYLSEVGGYYRLGDFDPIGGELIFIYDPTIGPINGVMEVDVAEVFEYLVMYPGEVSEGPFRLERTLLLTELSTTSPAGTFDDCVMIQELYYDEGMVLTDTVMTMLAYGVGPVYRMTNDVDLDVLVNIY